MPWLISARDLFRSLDCGVANRGGGQWWRRSCPRAVFLALDEKMAATTLTQAADVCKVIEERGRSCVWIG